MQLNVLVEFTMSSRSTSASSASSPVSPLSPQTRFEPCDSLKPAVSNSHTLAAAFQSELEKERTWCDSLRRFQADRIGAVVRGYGTRPQASNATLSVARLRHCLDTLWSCKAFSGVHAEPQVNQRLQKDVRRQQLKQIALVKAEVLEAVQQVCKLFSMPVCKSGC